MSALCRLLAASLALTLAGACASPSYELDAELWSPRADAPRIIRQGDAAQDTTAQPAAAAQPAGGGDSAAEIGKKLSNPGSNVWALFTEFDITSSDGRATGSPNNSLSIVFQPIMPIPLTEDSKLITRPTLPIFTDEPVASRDFDRYTGIGNLSLPILWSPNKPMDLWGGHLVYGFGPTMSFPTHTTSKLGTKAWEAGPTALLVWKDEKNTMGIFPQYFWSYSTYGNQDDTSRGQLLYFYWHELGNAWQVGTGPTATYNNEASSGNKWNVPVGLMVAKTMKFGDRIIKFQWGVEHSFIAQDDYGKQTQFRINVIPVISPPMKGPIF